MDETSQQKTGSNINSSRGKTKKRDRSASEERLLKAAEEVFSKHGFKGATTRMIADKAKVNESLIGRYFDGKMGLLLTLIENHLEDDDHRLTYPPQPTVREELNKLIESMYCEHCDKDTEFFKIVLSQCLTDAKFLKRIREIAPMKINPELRERLENLAKAGKIRPEVNLDLFIQTLDTFFHGSMLFEKLIMSHDDKRIRDSLHFVINTYASAVEK